MKLIRPYVEVVSISSNNPIHTIAECARVSHQSKTTDDEKLIRSLLEKGHMSVFEHVSMTIRFVTDVKIAMALLRHRHISVTQESTRYCNYTDKNKFPDGISVIIPSEIDMHKSVIPSNDWINMIRDAELTYARLISEGISPESARSVLPMCTATETIITTNLREWKHIIETRIDPNNHPDMIATALALQEACKEVVPIIFD